MCTNLRIRVISKLKSTNFFIIYQQDININTKKIKIGAWQKQYIAPNAIYYTILPQAIQLQGMNTHNNGIYTTKILNVSDYNTSYQLYELENALDIKSCKELTSSNECINLWNNYPHIMEGIVLKNRRPILSALIRPERKLSFFIKNILYIAICDYKINNDFFDADSITPTTYIDYSDQSHLTLVLKENESTGKFEVESNFTKFQYPGDDFI